MEQSGTELPTVRALELFCGIGGFAAATAGSNVRVVAALDQNPAALEVYRHNFPDHPVRKADLERISAWELTAPAADLWWLSPPCQPYCERGSRRDLNDPRARSLVRLLELLGTIPDEKLPERLALENVAGFAVSEARERLLPLLERRGYQVRELQLCPTGLGVPSRRPRYYLAATRGEFAVSATRQHQPRQLADYLNPAETVPEELLVDRDIIDRFGSGLRILDPADPAAYTTCFTSGYGKSIVNAGSYLRHGDLVRYFSPEEVARLLHFPPWFVFPPHLPLRKRWHLVGNSLSLMAVREVLASFAGLTFPAGAAAAPFNRAANPPAPGRETVATRA